MSIESQIEPQDPPPAHEDGPGLIDPDPEHERPPAGQGFRPAAGCSNLVHVEVSNTQNQLPIDADAVAAVVRGTLASEGIDRASISVAIVDDPTIRTINNRHLAHDWPTDVISFVLSDDDDPELSGELVVSAEMAVTTAAAAGVPAWDELALYLVHGLLHLCGHDDTTDDARAIMREREAAVLSTLGLSNTFSAAGGVAPKSPAHGEGAPSWQA